MNPLVPRDSEIITDAYRDDPAWERRTVRGGRDSIDHSIGGHDDVANVVAGLVHSILGVPDMTVSLIPPMFIRDGEIVDNEALPSWLRPKRPSYHSGVRPANYVVTVETQLARIDATRAMLETLSETYGATPVHTAIDELLFDLRKIAVALLPAARGADIEQREDETKCQ